MLRSDNTEVSPRPGHDIIQSGSGECEQFACVSFSGSVAACSRPCDKEGDSCEAGMVCRRVVLDPTTLPLARSRTEGQHALSATTDDYETLLAGLTDGLYCGPKP